MQFIALYTLKNLAALESRFRFQQELVAQLVFAQY